MLAKKSGGSYCILLDTGCNSPVVSRREFLTDIFDNDDRNSSNTLGGSYIAPFLATSVPFGQVAFDPSLPFSILSYYFVAEHGYIEPIDAMNFIAGFPTYEAGKCVEVKFKFIDGMLMGDGKEIVKYLNNASTYFTRSPSMGRLNQGKTKNNKPVKTRWSSVHPDLPSEIILNQTKLVPDLNDAQLNKLNLVLKLLKNSWHCSKRDLVNRIQSGKLVNTNVNPEDIEMFFKIFKYDVKKFQGSAKRTKLSAPKFRIRCNPSKGEIAITGDILQICGLYTLIQNLL